MIKKQIIFVETNPMVPIYKMARLLKLSKNYETVLVSFSKVNIDYQKKAFDKIIILDLDAPLSPKSIFQTIKKLNQRRYKSIFKELKKLNPYIVQITGPNPLPLLAFYLFKNKPIIYFAHDIWQPYGKKFSIIKGSGRMIYLNTIIEKFMFRKAAGTIYKGPEGCLNLLSYKIPHPTISFLPYCLDEWIIKPKLNKNKEWHLVFVGGPWIKWNGHASFDEIINKLSHQKIHFHIYSSSNDEYQKIHFQEVAKSNKYFHFHEKIPAEKLGEEISKYDYGVHFDFIDSSVINPNFTKITFGNKILSYIEAGLPIIVSEDCEFTCKFVKENNAGFSIGHTELGNLKTLLNKQNKSKVKLNVRKAQQKLLLSKHMMEIENFYKKVSEGHRLMNSG